MYEQGDGPAVLLVHGFPELAYSWRYQLPALAEAGYRAIAYDMRGYGRSSKPEQVEAYGLEILVDDLVRLLDSLGVERAAVVGHDWGSIVLWSAAVMNPDRVAAAVSLNVPYRGWCCGFPNTELIRKRLADRFAYVLSFQERGRPERAFDKHPSGWLGRVYRGIARDPDFMTEEEFSVYLTAFTEGGISGPINYYRNIDANWAVTARLADHPIATPTMVLAADSDPILPVSLTKGMDRWVSDLTVEVVADCGHWTQQEQPEKVNEALIWFLDRVPDQALVR